MLHDKQKLKIYSCICTLRPYERTLGYRLGFANLALLELFRPCLFELFSERSLWDKMGKYIAFQVSPWFLEGFYHTAEWTWFPWYDMYIGNYCDILDAKRLISGVLKALYHSEYFGVYFLFARVRYSSGLKIHLHIENAR